MTAELKPCERVEACIADVMARFPTDSKDYYVEVHQHLAPLARRLERELDEAKAELARRATPPSPSAAPTAQDQASAIKEVGDKMAGWLFGLSQSDAIFASWAGTSGALVREWDTVVGRPSACRFRAQGGNTIGSPSVAAPIAEGERKADLAKRLRIKAGMISMGEKIAWGSDSAIMLEAAEFIEGAALASRPAAKVELPPLPDHPEPRVMQWSELERRAIRAYGQECARAALAANTTASGKQP